MSMAYMSGSGTSEGDDELDSDSDPIAGEQAERAQPRIGQARGFGAGEAVDDRVERGRAAAGIAQLDLAVALLQQGIAGG